MKARKVVKGRSKRFTGKFPSGMLRPIEHLESLPELHAIFHFERHQLAATHQEQPLIGGGKK